MAAHTVEQARELLCQALDDPKADFRSGQWEAIDAIVNSRRKLLVVERTGWGKSLVYFIATRLLRDQGSGLTVIISPLLALMRNQISAGERLGIRPLTINSTNRDEWPELIERVQNGEADALLISPERLANDEFVENVLIPISSGIGLFVVDEAHCISDWGHDFRPDYRRLVNILSKMPANIPILGTTATANNRVIEDVQSQLGGIQIQRGPLMRESLSLQTLKLPDQSARLAWLAEHLRNLPGTGIVYTLTKRDAEQVAKWLRQNEICASAYYSGVESEDFDSTNDYRLFLEEQLLNNKIKVLVATTALGMGYDKPDLGFVIHFQAPGSIIAYYQQVGRAGRAMDNAYGILMSGREDEDIHEFFRNSAFPNEQDVNAILNALAESDGLSIYELQGQLNLRMNQIGQVLKYLSVDNPAPVLKQGPKWVRTAVEWRMDHEKIQRLTNQRNVEWSEIQNYIDSNECLMTFLANALDDDESTPCGKCANCRGSSVVPNTYSHELAVEASLYLKHSELELKCKIQVAKGAFPQYQFHGNLAKEHQAETGRILSRWGDAGWGSLVQEDKHSNHFRDDLVDALAEMILVRWTPDPFPTWVTCIPSINHPELVPSLAQRLAAKLKIKFIGAITKVRGNQPQKLQQNRYYQCSNLDGVFEIVGDIPTGSVLLVDDIVDSAWTMTVAAALLRQADSGQVFPVTLATTATWK